jgi:hypothetical protein
MTVNESERSIRAELRSTTDGKQFGFTDDFTQPKATPDGCAIRLQALTKYKNSAKTFFS